MRRASLLVESGWSPDNQMLMSQPIVSTLDLIYRREGEARFKPVEVSLLLESLAAMSAEGVLKNLLSATPEGGRGYRDIDGMPCSS